MIVSIHSYRGGTGKSNLTAKPAYQLAAGLSQDAPRTLDVSGLNAGVYILRLQGPSGHQSARFIKQ